jgi:hypothetical protein
MSQKHKTLKLWTFQFGYNVYKQEKNYFNTHVWESDFSAEVCD